MKTYIITEEAIENFISDNFREGLLTRKIREFCKSEPYDVGDYKKAQLKYLCEKGISEKLKSGDNSEFTHRWIDDVKRIHKILSSRGYSSTLEVCANSWENYSDSMCAGWMNLPKEDEDVFNIVLSNFA
jgi:hypothetical protein